MTSTKKVLLAVSALLAFSLVAGTAVAEQNCRKVKARMTAVSDIYTSADGFCNEYDECQYGDFKGFPKGRLWTRWYVDWYVFALDNLLLISTDTVFDTPHGQIYGSERGMNVFDWETFTWVDGYVSHIHIIGGTGRYLEATGWMNWGFGYQVEEYGWLRGEICGPYIHADDDEDSDDDSDSD